MSITFPVPDERPRIDRDEHARNYADYLWRHIPLFTWWATDVTKINADTLRFRRIDDSSGYYFFTATDLLIGARRAARLLQAEPRAFSVSLLARTRIPRVLNDDWRCAPTDRTFVALALQLAVFERVTFSVSQDMQHNLLSA